MLLASSFNSPVAPDIMAGHSRSAVGAIVFALLLNWNIDRCTSLVPTSSLAGYKSRSVVASPRASATLCSLSSTDLQDETAQAAVDTIISQKSPKRTNILKLLGLHKEAKAKSEPERFEVTTVQQLNDYFDDVQNRFRKKGNDSEIDYNALLASLSVKGDTQIIGSSEHKDVVHPVVQLVHERRRQIEKIKKENRDQVKISDSSRGNVQRTLPPDDGCRVALAIEGGGMRGCVTAGMVTAIHYLGLEDTVDVVYGSSAGTVIGAYFITRQLPWFGPEVYYDALTTAGDRFINTKRFLRAVGLGLLDPRLAKDVIFRRNHGKPVLDLSYLLKTTMQEQKPLGEFVVLMC